MPPYSLSHLAVRELSSGRRSRLVIRGELDVGTSPLLHGRLRLHVHDEELVLDLRELSFMDACGVGVIVAALACRQEHGLSLALRVAPGSQPQRLLALLGYPPQATLVDAAQLVASRR